MIKYLWINPVVWSQYDPGQLEQAVRQRGYQPVQCRKDHIAGVKAQYRAEVRKGEACILDMRCPAAVRYVREHYPDCGCVFPSIDPILIQSAQEAAKLLQPEKQDTLTVVTPCTQLSGMGQERGMASVEFLTWREFQRKENIVLGKKRLEASPIPPGFFSEYGEDAASLSTGKEISAFFAAKGYERKKIVEMLFCAQGCHHGNGV